MISALAVFQASHRVIPGTLSRWWPEKMNPFCVELLFPLTRAWRDRRVYDAGFRPARRRFRKEKCSLFLLRQFVLCVREFRRLGLLGARIASLRRRPPGTHRILMGGRTDPRSCRRQGVVIDFEIRGNEPDR